MFSGSPDGSIELIHDLGDPRVYTSPVNAALSRDDLASRSTASRCSSTSATSSRPRPKASSRCRRSARASPAPRSARSSPFPIASTLLADVTTRWLRLEPSEERREEDRALRLQFPARAGQRRRRVLPRRCGLDSLDARGAGRRRVRRRRYRRERCRYEPQAAGDVPWRAPRRRGERRRDSRLGPRPAPRRTKRCFTRLGVSRPRRSRSRACATATCSCCCKTCAGWKTSR